MTTILLIAGFILGAVLRLVERLVEDDVRALISSQTDANLKRALNLLPANSSIRTEWKKRLEQLDGQRLRSWWVARRYLRAARSARSSSTRPQRFGLSQEFGPLAVCAGLAAVPFGIMAWVAPMYNHHPTVALGLLSISCGLWFFWWSFQLVGRMLRVGLTALNGAWHRSRA